MKQNKLKVKIPINNFFLSGILQIPKNARSIVLFAHGSGSNQLSTRNQHVANILNEANIATLLFDLLNHNESKTDKFTREYRFNITLLASRLIAVTDWISQEIKTKNLIIGYFGASTGAAAALQAATERSNIVKAIISRGGRPDLSEKALSLVQAPTLFIAGDHDKKIIEMNKQVMEKMSCVKEFEMIPGATHLFEEPGALDEVTKLTKKWFVKYLI